MSDDGSVKLEVMSVRVEPWLKKFAKSKLPKHLGYRSMSQVVRSLILDEYEKLYGTREEVHGTDSKTHS